MVWPISIGFSTGPTAWSSRVFARPSQNCDVAYAALITVGALRAPFWWLIPSLVGVCSAQAIFGSWQVAHEIVWSLLMRVSK